MVNKLIPEKLYSAYGATQYDSNAEILYSYSPIDNALLGSVPMANEENYESVIKDLQEAYLKWRVVPAPQRGMILKEIGEEFKKYKDELGKLVSLETGKILEEGKGEVQEAIDMIDFAVGLSRQLYGLTIKSERSAHRMMEQWHPLGIVGVITAFNFPVAVWAWNSVIASVCGNVVLWKPSELTPLVSIAVNEIARRVTARHNFTAIFGLVIGDHRIGEKISADRRIPLVSATGSTTMGKVVAKTVAERLGKTILELGGNNGVIVMNDADLKVAVPAIVFGAVGTAGQRCTSTRRILVQKEIKDKLIKVLINAYQQVRVGHSLEPETLMGPLINQQAVNNYLTAIETAKLQGGKVLFGAEVFTGKPSNLFVAPTLIEATPDMPIVKQETFAPIAYIIEFNDLEEAIRIHNDVPQGLSSAIFTENIKNCEKFISESGSDCGIANINLGTSGAEIGGAFGGEKETGGGREAGSDSWKAYMRRQTSTINYSDKLPLAQGIKFDLKLN